MNRQEFFNAISTMGFIRVKKDNTGRGYNANITASRQVKIRPGLYYVDSVFTKKGDMKGDVTYIFIKGHDRRGNYNGYRYMLVPQYDYSIVPALDVVERFLRDNPYMDN